MIYIGDIFKSNQFINTVIYSKYTVSIILKDPDNFVLNWYTEAWMRNEAYKLLIDTDDII